MNLDKTEIQKPKDFTVGMDIEFVATDGFKAIDPKLHNYSVKKYGNIGWDGGGSTRIFELRPNYSYNPLDLTYNIHGILREKIKNSPKFAEYIYHAGACYQDKFIGAHLHYGQWIITMYQKFLIIMLEFFQSYWKIGNKV